MRSQHGRGHEAEKQAEKEHDDPPEHEPVGAVRMSVGTRTDLGWLGQVERLL
jgi:hypothetical protein